MLFVFCANREQSFYGSGTIETTAVLLSSEVSGQVIGLAVQEGDAVEEGQVIAVIDSERVFLQKQRLLASRDELTLTLEQAWLANELAKETHRNIQRKYSRLKTLLQDSSVTQQQFDDISVALKETETAVKKSESDLRVLDAKLRQLNAEIELIDKQLRNVYIRAPFSGIVLEKYIEEGELVRTGGAVAALADLKRMWIKFYVSGRDLGAIGLGDSIRIRTDSQESRNFFGTVSWISPRAEFTPKNVQTREARADLVYAVKVDLENPDGSLKIGMPADVYIE
jgi:HlyD family secretion protein